jgi:hypothetical protein
VVQFLIIHFLIPREHTPLSRPRAIASHGAVVHCVAVQQVVVADIPASASHTLSTQGRRCCELGAGMSRARGGGARRVTYVF